MEGPPTSDGRGESEPLLPCCSWCLGENSQFFCGRVGSATWKLTCGDMHEASQASLACSGEAASSRKPSSLLQVGLGTLVPGLQLHTMPLPVCSSPVYEAVSPTGATAGPLACPSLSPHYPPSSLHSSHTVLPHPLVSCASSHCRAFADTVPSA